MVIEIESIAKAPETHPTPPFFLVIHPQALEKKKEKQMHFIFWWEVVTLCFRQRGGTKPLFSVSEAHSS